MKTLDYQFAFAEAITSGDAPRVPCAYRFVSLATHKGAPLFCAILEGRQDSIRSQISVKLALDAMLDRALEITHSARSAPNQLTLPAEIVREAMKEGNTRVYQYGHQMGAGGQMGAAGFVFALEGDKLSAARVGTYEGLLCREGKFIPLFDAHPDKEEHAQGTLARFVGANAQVLVDMASATLKAGDLLVLTNEPDYQEFSRAVEREHEEQHSLQELAKYLALEESQGRRRIWKKIVLLLQFGRPTILLK